MAQQWSVMLEQLGIAKRIMLDGNALVPAWRIDAPDGAWLILTPFDHDKPDQREHMLQLIRRFMAWKLAQSFVLVGETLLGSTTAGAREEAVFVVGHVRGERLAFLQRVRREPSLSFGGLECVKPRDIDPAYWSVLPTCEETVAVLEAASLAVIFGDDGELPAQKLS
jgi:hypothetical protein